MEFVDIIPYDLLMPLDGYSAINLINSVQVFASWFLAETLWTDN